MVDYFNTSFFDTTSEVMVKVNTLEKLLNFNSSIENNPVGITNSTFKNKKSNEVDWFEYEWVSTNATEKPMFDYDTSVRVVMLSVLLGLAISILIRIIVISIIFINRSRHCWQQFCFSNPCHWWSWWARKVIMMMIMEMIRMMMMMITMRMGLG